MERALQEKNRPLHRENFWSFSFILVDGTYKCIHCQRKMKKKMFRKIIFKPSSEATRRGLWMALVVPSPNCPSSLSPQENTSPTTTKKKKFPVRFDIFILDNTENQTLPYLYQCMPHNGGSHKLRQWLFCSGGPKPCGVSSHGRLIHVPSGGNLPYPWRSNVFIL